MGKRFGRSREKSLGGLLKRADTPNEHPAVPKEIAGFAVAPGSGKCRFLAEAHDRQGSRRAGIRSRRELDIAVTRFRP